MVLQWSRISRLLPGRTANAIKIRKYEPPQPHRAPSPPSTTTASCDKSTQPHNTASPLLPPLAPGREQLVPFIVMQRHMQLPPFFYAASVLVRIATLVAMRPGSPLQGTARQAPTQLAPPRCRYQGSIPRLGLRRSGHRPSGLSPKYDQGEWAT